MYHILTQGAGFAGLVLMALPWILMVVVPAIFILAMVAYIIHYVSSPSESGQSRKKVLVVDDDEASITGLLSILSVLPVEVRVVKSGEEMRKEIIESDYDLLFVDRFMPKQTGDAALAQADSIASHRKRIPVVFFTGNEKGLNLPEFTHFDIEGIWEKRTSYLVLEDQVHHLLNKVGQGPASKNAS